ncbi:MAG: hypothetical protein QT05_C0005G0028 [archaeon GW2011_AR13]|nr:MAG: hypothetical protein QT05_C0005G0028 [archaeon GW2011_AR13]HIG94465.1 hypothetical protein [Nanoarchaeota archaeon]HIH62975.1 hypothetical protein [Nanoarchaeota archaeon]HIJ10240.1 hypothetical protein [Nanoarchaeota archaeon]
MKSKSFLFLFLIVFSFSFVSAMPPTIDVSSEFKVDDNIEFFLNNTLESNMDLSQIKIYDSNDAIVYGSGPIGIILTPGQEESVFVWNQQGNSGTYNNNIVPSGSYKVTIIYSYEGEAKNISKVFSIRLFCSDTDGGLNFYTKGHIEDIEHGNAVYDDTCTTLETTDSSGGWTPTQQGKILMEYYCEDKNYQYTPIECENGCMEGKCMPESYNENGCKDSDGGLNFYYKGIVQGEENGEYLSKEDSCKYDPINNKTFLVEGYCQESGVPALLTIECSNGCYEGICLGDSDEVFECKEDDEKNPFVKGYIEGPYYESEDGSFVTEMDLLEISHFYDKCSEKEEGYLLEYYCYSGLINSESIKCDFGCYDGGCLTEDSDVLLPNGCTEKDGGKNYYEKSAIYIDGEYHNEDKCSEDQTLNEWFCNSEGTQEVEAYECEEFCANGRCYKENEIFEDGNCNGCLDSDNCYPFGFRKEGNYCSDENNEFVFQKNPELTCENSFECDSNLCINNQCVSGSLWAKFLRWFKSIFG